MPNPFDPLRYLTHELHALPAIEAGSLVMRFDGPVSAGQREEAWKVVRAYERLLWMQLDNGGASVRKLMAWGRLKIVGRRYVLVGGAGKPGEISE